MARRLIVSAVLGVFLVVVQLVSGTGWPAALVTGGIGFVVALLVLLVADRWFSRNPR
jgi:high-affinity Fe2+/Pb2+ permease